MPPPAQSVSPLAPIGVSAALQGNPTEKPKPKIFDEFALKDRVGIVSGGNRGLGLEMAFALCEAGARAVYCLDLPEKPSEEWQKTKEFLDKMDIGARLEYISVDVTDQQKVWKVAAEIGDREKRMDVCVAAAGILKAHTDCLHYPAEQFKQVCVRASRQVQGSNAPIARSTTSM
jgi:NAD(P)-dependent dehydrogenase (short-subunit alcohol dehydrogenase family)